VVTTTRCIESNCGTTTLSRPFQTESGHILPEIRIAWESWGRLSIARDNVILVTHALTGDAHAASHGPGDPPGWFEGMIGPGRALDTDQYYVICMNMLGGCNGSTGPRSINPETGHRYNLSFPMITVRDIVRSQALALEQMGIDRLHSIIGGSLGGMQALEWAAIYPDRVLRIVPIAASGYFSPQGIAYNEVQRRAIMLDPAFQNGEYEDGGGPTGGLAVARMLGMITYQSDELMTSRFGRSTDARYHKWPEFLHRYDVEGYLHYQGDKLVRRFDANSYLYLTRAMDSHDLGWKRGGYRNGLALIQAPTLTVGISSDILFPASYSRDVVEDLTGLGRRAQYVEMDSPHGHDAFLKDFDQLGELVKPFVDE
jgi:homoserine O-acetyltransferase/O-succinyltransferase